MNSGCVPARFKRRITDAPPLFAGWITSSIASCEPLVQGGFDAVVFDMQHGVVDYGDCLRGIDLAALLGVPALVRLPVAEFALAARLFDAGAAAVIAPMIDSPDDARRLVEFTKFPPLGQRSFGPHRALQLTGMNFPEYLACANELQLVIAMIETREALASLDQIVQVAGIDGVFVGPGDLSIALSDGKRIDPASQEVFDALRLVQGRSAHFGKIAGAFCLNGDHAARVAAMGFHFCSVGVDSYFLRDMAALQSKAARGFASAGP